MGGLGGWGTLHYNINMHPCLKIGSMLLVALLGLLACGDRRTAPTGVEAVGAVVLLTAKVDAEVAARIVQVEVVVTAVAMPTMRRTLAVAWRSHRRYGLRDPGGCPPDYLRWPATMRPEPWWPAARPSWICPGAVCPPRSYPR